MINDMIIGLKKILMLMKLTRYIPLENRFLFYFGYTQHATLPLLRNAIPPAQQKASIW